MLRTKNVPARKSRAPKRAARSERAERGERSTRPAKNGSRKRAEARNPHEKLRTYRAKRHFDVTPEPSGEASRPAEAPSTSFGYVIQKHAASHLHYDFRLELDGVLLSWSVPKGPSLSPKTRRLAMRTEDHPLSYADFEGVIPQGEYGGGTVLVWDQGTWKPDGDPREGLRKGNLTFTLRGDKLHGRWHLVRTSHGDEREAWILFKGRDEAASETRDIVVEAPNSTVTQRSIDEVAHAQDRVWRSNRPPKEAPRGRTRARAKAPARKEPPPDLHALVQTLPVSFKLTNVDKVLYPEQGLTKGALFAYLAVVRDWILPHVAGRPLTLVRCPEGHHKHCFFQKHVGDAAPKSVKRIPIREDDGSMMDYFMVEDLDGLLATTQLGALELHTWGCHYPKVEKPDVMVFDLDPDPTVAWDEVVRSAFDVRASLRILGLESLVKTTGGKGLHVVVPLAPKLDWETFKAFSKALVSRIERAYPDRFTTNILKAKRRGRIFLDYLRNGRGATFVAPYSMRARPSAPVATPVTWEELEQGVAPNALTILTVPRRLESIAKDPWADYAALAKQSITAAALRKVGM